ncbi:hypothetical protein VDG1235_4314 [Verrucomicrobiia bacterium DG1235]|nr:hypothetical protein VDG1235_4314 [Verrucomicrobiae bacterium DG1235]
MLSFLRSSFALLGPSFDGEAVCRLGSWIEEGRSLGDGWVVFWLVWFLGIRDQACFGLLGLQWGGFGKWLGRCVF